MTAFALLVAGVVAIAGVAAVGRSGGRRPSRRRVPDWAREAPVGREESERRSLALLESVVNADEWEMYRDLGFICTTGRRFRRDGREALPRYRYLIYPHRPLVALLPRSMAPVREYCVQFPDDPRAGDDGLLPSGDDVLAKWMTVRADEDRLLVHANVSNPGCQIPLSRIERDLRRLARWEERRGRPEPAPSATARY